MLRFQQTPDKILIEILMTSMDITIDLINEIVNYSETIDNAKIDIAGLLPLAMGVYSPEAALSTLIDLKDKLQRPELYYLNDYHYLLLYDVLDFFVMTTMMAWLRVKPSTKRKRPLQSENITLRI